MLVDNRSAISVKQHSERYRGNFGVWTASVLSSGAIGVSVKKEAGRESGYNCFSNPTKSKESLLSNHEMKLNVSPSRISLCFHHKEVNHEN